MKKKDCVAASVTSNAVPHELGVRASAADRLAQRRDELYAAYCEMGVDVIDLSRTVRRFYELTLDYARQRDELAAALRGYMAGHACSDKAGDNCPTHKAAVVALAKLGSQP